MEIDLTPEQYSFVHLAVEQGRFSRAEDAVQDALLLWQKRERARAELLLEIDSGRASLNSGEVALDSQDSIRNFVDGVKRRGHSKLAGL